MATRYNKALAGGKEIIAKKKKMGNEGRRRRALGWIVWDEERRIDVRWMMCMLCAFLIPFFFFSFFLFSRLFDRKHTLFLPHFCLNSFIDEIVEPVEWVNMLIETMECQGAPQNHLSLKRRRSWKKTVLTAYEKVLRIFCSYFSWDGFPTI